MSRKCQDLNFFANFASFLVIFADVLCGLCGKAFNREVREGRKARKRKPGRLARLEFGIDLIYQTLQAFAETMGWPALHPQAF
jgi:hypothetical protein